MALESVTSSSVSDHFFRFIPILSSLTVALIVLFFSISR